MTGSIKLLKFIFCINSLSKLIIEFLLQEATFLEACIENHTKSNLFMDQVEFEPAPHWSATILKADEHHTESNSQARSVAHLSFELKEP